jgi:hypothetical protein
VLAAAYGFHTAFGQAPQRPRCALRAAVAAASSRTA